MKLATFRYNRQTRLGLVQGEKIIDVNAGQQYLMKQTAHSKKSLPAMDMKSFLSRGAEAIRMARRVEAWVKEQVEGSSRPPAAIRAFLFDLKKVKILAPLSNPPKILCLARNYVSHAVEVAGNAQLPQSILIFMKPSTAIIGPGEEVVIPPDCRKLDHEVELAVVIGKKGRYIPEKLAMDHVAGYTIFNDMSDREYIVQKETGRVNWFFMKAQDTFAPMGPYLVLKDEVDNPHALRLRLWVNGELRQDSPANDMIFKIPEIISKISHFVTLEPGDIIATGTPTGTAFSTQKYLNPGDVMVCEIEGIGRLENSVEVEKDDYRSS